MTAALLTTKFYTPPARPRLVARPGLIERLNRNLDRKLTLVSAPAGYGKTTLISAWLHDLDRPFSWLSLDAGDNDPARFFTYLVAALAKVYPGLGEALQGRLSARELPPAETLMTALINDLAAAPGPLLLVLDDYHLLTELAVHQGIDFLLERGAPQLHLVLLTRHDPPLSLSRLRGRGQVTELRQRDLRFSPEEAAAFLNQFMGLALTPAEIALLERRTEGWIAGLQLAALSMQGRDDHSRGSFIQDFTGRHHLILDYLTDEVLRQQPEPVHTFLLQTCILDRICGELGDAVTGAQEGPGARAQLEYLEHANLFLIPLDDERRWYRYHHLFAELLRARLLESAPDRLPELHRRAALWYDARQLPAEAVRHALATGDMALAAELIERAIKQIASWSRGDVGTLLGWLEALPEALVRARPWLRLFASRTLYVAGHWTAGQRMLEALEQTLQEDPSIPGAHQVMGSVLADRASYAAVQGEVSRAIAYARRAQAHAGEGNPFAQLRAHSNLGLACLRAGRVSEAQAAFSQAVDIALAQEMFLAAVPMLCNLAEVYLLRGQLNKVVGVCERARGMAAVKGGTMAAAGYVGLQLAKVQYHRNQLSEAERSLLEGLKLLGRGGVAEGFGSGYAVLAQVRQALGDSQGAREAMQKALRLVPEGVIPRLDRELLAYQARLHLAQGRIDRAARWAADYMQAEETEYARDLEELTLARVRLAQDRPREALTRLEALRDTAEAAGRGGTLVEVLVLQSLALGAPDDREKALETLARALALAEPEGYLRLLMEGGAPLAALLRQLDASGRASDYARRILAALEAEPGAHEPAGDLGLLAEPLTEREMQVLALLARGHTNAEIGRQLHISLPTVKSHTRSIYGKLAVHGRREAVARARTLGLLPPI